MANKAKYRDIINALEDGNWQILDIHYAAILKRQRSEALQQVHDDITAFCELHYDGNGKNYHTVIGGLRMWEAQQNSIDIQQPTEPLAELASLRAENARLRIAVHDLNEVIMEAQKLVATVWDDTDAATVKRDYRFLTETMNELDAVLEEVAQS